jgi:hypothetical protein
MYADFAGVPYYWSHVHDLAKRRGQECDLFAIDPGTILIYRGDDEDEDQYWIAGQTTLKEMVDDLLGLYVEKDGSYGPEGVRAMAIVKTALLTAVAQIDEAFDNQPKETT